MKLPAAFQWTVLLALYCASLVGGVAAVGPAPLPFKPDIIVAADGSGDFKTIQAALQSIPRDSAERRVVFIKKGLYPEKIRIDAANVTLRGEDREQTRIEFAQGAGEFRTKRDDLGQAVVNIGNAANDCVIENLTVKNTHGVIGTHAFAIFGAGDRTVIMDCDVLSQGNDTLSLWRTNDRATEADDKTDTLPNGRYYHARLKVCGSVDFICPRGWCYMKDSTITEVNPKAEAAIWHDGSRDKDMKFVLKNCQFDGVENWGFARWHHDAQFFLLDCTFSQAMRDHAPFRVVYPLNGGTATEADRKRNEELAPTNVWGNRVYFFNSHRSGGDYTWLKDNFAAAPGSPKPEQITAAWTFGGKWDPERIDGPHVKSVRVLPDLLELTFDEIVTVKGLPAIALARGERATYTSGSGTRSLQFKISANETPAPTSLDFTRGVIIATQAAATIRVASTTLP